MLVFTNSEWTVVGHRGNIFTPQTLNWCCFINSSNDIIGHNCNATLADGAVGQIYCYENRWW